MRAFALVMCLTMAGCTRPPVGQNDVDLNAAATAAQEDIVHYAATRHRRAEHPAPRNSPSAMSGQSAE